MKLLSALTALALALTLAGAAAAPPSDVAMHPVAEVRTVASSDTSEPVPITVDGVDMAELEDVPEAPRAAEGPQAVEATDAAGAPATSLAPEPAPEPRSARREACTARDFRDVPRGHTFYTSVRWMACEELTTGYRNGTFGAKRQLSRGEAAMFLYRLSGETHHAGSEVDFRDVPVDSAAFTAVSWMKEKGYSTGYQNGTFGRGKDIQRRELAAFLYRMSGQTHRTTAYSPYTDMTRQDSMFAAAAWLRSTEIITGYTDRTFRPQRAVTRGEASAFIYAFDQVRDGTAPKPTANRWTTVATPLHATAAPQTRAVRTLLPQTGVVRLTERGSMTQVRAGSTTGWVNSDFLSRGKPGTTTKPYPKPTQYTERAANNMAPWCWKIPMTTFDGTDAWAQYKRSGSDAWPSTYQVDELIGLGHDLDADSVPARAVQLHECAHILQYRTYRYDKDTLDAGMQRVYPNGRHDGVEHMADCMADAMGARRVSSSGGATWTVGYGGSCSSAQMAAARKVIAGVRP